jgi:hypothetical protein
MSDPRPVNAFCKFFGLRKTVSSSRLLVKPTHRAMHVAHAGGERGIKILKMLLPFLLSKAQEAKMAIRFYEETVVPYPHRVNNFNRKPVPSWLLARRHRFYLKMQQLKRRKFIR